MQSCSWQQGEVPPWGQGLSGSRDGLAGVGDPDTAWVVLWQQPLLVVTPYIPFSSYPCGTGCGEPGLCWDRAWGRLQLWKPLFSAGLMAVAWPPGLCLDTGKPELALSEAV